jgi:hypothetical protein
VSVVGCSVFHEKVMQVIYVGRLFWAFTVVEVVGAPRALCREWAAKSSSEDLCHWGGCWVLELPFRIA